MPVPTLSAPRVQHVPAAHPYSLAVTPDQVEPLPDPPVAGAPEGRWWPHAALEPAWVAATTAEVVHLHFGFEHRTTDQMRAWVSSLRDRDIPLVFTVHDLLNPHLGPSAQYDALLDVVVPAADVLTTLTAGAATTIRERWGCDAIVHPHPHVVAPDWLEAPRTEHDGWVVGVHAKSVRASLDVQAISVAAGTLRDLPGAVLRLHVHDDVLDAGHPRHDPTLTTLTRAGDIDVRVHGPLSDEELWRDLLDTDLALLPYGFATHSGWLEMCHDLGTPVLAADVGHLASQRPIRTYTDLPDLARQLTRAHAAHRAGERPTRPAAAARLREVQEVRALHADLYARVSSGVAR